MRTRLTDTTARLALALLLAVPSALAEKNRTEEPIGAEAGQPTRITGTVRLFSDSGEPIDDRRRLDNAVVYFEPDDAPKLNPPKKAVTMTTRRRQFEPRVLPVVAGTEVRFPNEDPILHNVFSDSTGNQFDLGVYRKSPGKSHRFDNPGLVRVFCNVHSRMSAHIVVVNSPYFVTPERDGSFELADLPPGPGRLTLWHERSQARQVEIDLAEGEQRTEDANLELTVREVEPQRQRFRRRGRY